MLKTCKEFHNDQKHKLPSGVIMVEIGATKCEIFAKTPSTSAMLAVNSKNFCPQSLLYFLLEFRQIRPKIFCF